MRESAGTPPEADREQVLVVPRHALFDGRWPHGFTPLESCGDDIATRLEHAASLMDREAAERDPDFKQPIPYCAVRRGDDILCVERLPKQGETRLHGKLSIGLGGHVGPEDLATDGSTTGAIQRALHRELAEELVLPGGLPEPRFVGLIHDDSTPVGAVHVGLAFVLDVPLSTPSDAVQLREILKMRGGFRRLAGDGGAWQDAPSLESWSAVLLDVCLGDIGRSVSTGPSRIPRSGAPSSPPGSALRTQAKESGNGGAQDSETVA